MGENLQNDKPFLKEQLEWCKEQDRILIKIERNLHEMKKIAEYAVEHELDLKEKNELNDRLNHLKDEVIFLEQQLHSIVN